MLLWEKYMDIFFLRRQGLTMREIARQLGIHRNTVKKYLTGASPPGYRKVRRKDPVIEPYHKIIQDFLEEDSYKATWIFDRIRRMGYGGGYDTVKNFVRAVKGQKQRLAYIRFETMPGRQAQVDWADFQVTGPDGRTTTYYLFIMTLGFSRAMYAELVTRCTLDVFMDCHIRAFRYLGGAAGEILYDNMKNVVKRRIGKKAEFNVEFLHFAHHYGFKPVACPPWSPWVKGKAERPIDYLRERFWRGYRFRGIDAANRDLLFFLDETANHRIHGTHRQPVNARWEEERPHLVNLPPRDYDTAVKVYRKVYRDCLVSWNGSRYQVPHTVVGKKILLKIKEGIIRCYDDDKLLVTHQEATQKGSFVTHPQFTEDLRRDREHQRRKYGRVKGKATRGLTDSSLYPQVIYRPLADYDRLIPRGGGAWTN